MPNLELVVKDIEGVEFYTDTKTGKSGINQSGLAILCGVSQQAVSKLLKSIRTSKPYKGLEHWIGANSSNIWKTKSGMVLLSEPFALDIIRYCYTQGKCSEMGCKAIGMPVLKTQKSKSKGTEANIRGHLQQKLGGTTEVLTEAGRIDLITATEIIEIKEVKSWKAGLGQILVYSAYYPSHAKRLHLFGDCHESFLAIIQKHCNRFNIVLTWES